MNIRIIPRLDIKGPNLVKGINFEGLRVLGKPEKFARYYYENGADELIYMDAVASLYNRNSLTDIVERTARETFIPLTVGGGLRSLVDIRQVLRAGADKVSLNTAAIANPDMIKQAAHAFGSSTILVSIEALRRSDGTYEACVDFGRELTGVDVFKWALQAVELGAGELMVTAIDREGTGKGFDLELIRRIAQSVSVPVIAAGGAGKAEDIYAAVHEGSAQAVAIASILHYHACDKPGMTDSEYSEEGNTEFLHRKIAFNKIKGCTIEKIKTHLSERNVSCRMTSDACNEVNCQMRKPMPDQVPVTAPDVAIVDCGLGNLHSVKQACRFVHLNGIITSDKKTILEADAVILPGVGAFGHAMDKLTDLDLVGVLRDVAASKKPLIGICLGFQLFMSESYEFGCHQGLNLFKGSVVPFDDPEENSQKLKIPHVGWNRIYPCGEDFSSAPMFKGIPEGEYMYFVHSYVVQPENSDVKVTRTKYGNVEFCSSIYRENLWGFQFHPERSGAEGLKIYQNFANYLYSTVNGGCPCQ